VPALNSALSKSELSKKYQPLFSSQQKPRLISCWACHSTLSQQQRTQRRRGEREKIFCLFISSRLKPCWLSCRACNLHISSPAWGEKTPREHIYNHGPILTVPALNSALSKSELSKKYKPLFSSQQKPRLISCWACHSTLSQQQRTQRRRGERESFLPLYKFTVKTVLAFVPGL